MSSDEHGPQTRLPIVVPGVVRIGNVHYQASPRTDGRPGYQLVPWRLIARVEADLRELGVLPPEGEP